MRSSVIAIRKLSLIMLLLIFYINTSTFAQKRIREYNPAFLNSEMRLDESGKMPIAIRFEEGEQLRLNNFFEEYHKTFSLPDETEMQLYKRFSDEFGQTHYRYNQYYKGIRIIGAQYVLHEKAGYIHFANGRLLHNLEMDVIPALTEKQALDIALGVVGAESYMWENHNNDTFLKQEQNDPQASFYPRGELKLSSGNEDFLAENIRLVYRFDIYAEKPPGRYYVDVDAKTGEIVSKISRLHLVDVSGTGQSQYNGLVNITVDSFTGTGGNAYRLREIGRSGIRTYDMQNGKNYLAALDFVEPDTSFTASNAVAGVSVHWAMEAAYDYFLNTHSRNSYNGSGGAILNYSHYGLEVNDAFWDGTRFTFGDGDGWMYSPMVSLDIVGHEFTHAVVEHSAGLIYANESGSLSESFSDIFATAIEFYKEGTSGDWLIGEDVTLQNFAMRSLEDPNSLEQPDTYLGNYWAPLSTNPDPENDYGGIHTNAGVHNYWFYLLVQGGSGVNDFGVPYSVTGIGFQDAAQIAYRNLTAYLIPSAKHRDAREGAVQAAIDLFGAASAKVQAVKDAWNAVGVDDPPPPASILVWDGVLNGQDYSGAYISNYLTNAGFTVNYSDVFPSSMLGYDAVFLSFGNYGSNGSTRTEFTTGMASVVKAYLEAGGRVYLEGGDALGFDQSGNTTLLNLFGLFTAQDGDQNPINGLEGQNESIADGMLFTSSSQVNMDYIDRYTPGNGTVAFFESSYDNVSVQNTGTYGQRTFCFSYALAGLNDGVSPGTKDDLMAALVAFLIPGTPEIVLSPTSFNLAVPVGDSTTAILGIYNTGSSLLSWSIRDQSIMLQLSNGKTVPVRKKKFRVKPERDIFDSKEWEEKFRSATRLSDVLPAGKPPVTEETGDILDTFTAPGTPFPVGLVYDAALDAVWVTDENGGKVFLVEKNPPYNVLQTINLSVGFTAGPYDITVKGDTLYITDFNGAGTVNDAIYAINKNSGALIDLWQLDGLNNPNPADAIDQVIGITVNDAGEFFVSNNVNKIIRKIALLPGGMWQTLQTFESPVGKRTAGLNWDSEQNGFWVANIVDDPVYLTGANFNKVDSFPEPGNFSSGVTSLGNMIMWVSDFGSGEIYVIEGTAPPCPWISETPLQGYVATNENQNVELLIDASQLSPGTYTCNLLVSSDDPDESLLTVPVTLNVIPVNEPPALTPIVDQLMNEGDTLLVAVATTDPDSNSSAVVLRAKNLPPFATFADSGNGNGIITFMPGYFDAGVFPNIRIISVDNGLPALSDTTTFTLTVNNVNRSPVISVLSDTSLFEDDTLNIYISAADPDGDSLAFLTGNFPSFGTVIDSGNGSGMLVLTPGYFDAGVYSNVRIISIDNGLPALSDTTTFTLTVHNVNRAPTISLIPDTSVSEGDTLGIYISAADPDGDSLAFSTGNFPSFGTVIDSGNGSGMLAFTPGYFDAGVYPNVRIISIDNGLPALADTTTFTLTVHNVNRAPTISLIPDTSVSEGDTLDIYISAADPDGDNLTLSTGNFPSFGTLLNSGNGNGIVRFTPGYENAGTYLNLEVVVTDTGVPPLSANTIFTLEVYNTNRAPVFASIPDTVTAEGDTLEMTVSATDPDGNNIVLSTENLPPFGSFNDNGDGSGKFVFMPGFNSAGNYFIDVIATDDGIPMLSDTTTFMLTVNGTNRAPIITAINDQTVNEGEILHVPVTAIDPDGDSLVLSVNNLPLFATFVDSSNGKGTFRFAPGYNDDGIYGNIQITATDNGVPPLFDQEIFNLTVIDVNRAPVAMDDADSTDEDILVTIDVLINDHDPDDDPLAIYDVITEMTAGTVLFAPGDTIIAFQPARDSSGVDLFRYVISDGRGGLDTATVTIDVRPVNDVPDISGLPDSLSFDADSSYTLNIWEGVYDPETPDSLLTYEFLAIPDTLELNFNVTSGLLNIAAKNKVDGVRADLEVTVTDPEGKSSVKTVSVRVISVLGIDEGLFSQVPREYVLMQNYPNPFNPSTQIRYGLPKTAKVKVQVVNILGQIVATLVNDYKLAGYHKVTFDARYLASGIYFYHIQAGKFQAVKKMILLK